MHFRFHCLSIGSNACFPEEKVADRRAGVLIFQTPGKAGVSFLLERGSLWEYLDLRLFKGLN